MSKKNTQLDYGKDIFFEKLIITVTALPVWVEVACGLPVEGPAVEDKPGQGPGLGMLWVPPQHSDCHAQHLLVHAQDYKDGKQLVQADQVVRACV